jgi:lipopolysaccharide heptosyltransferase II
VGLATSAVEEFRMKALVIETAFLGDAIVSLSLAEALKQQEPSAEITYLVRPEAVDILNYAPAVDRVIAYDKYGSESGVEAIKEKANELDRLNFDVIFSLHESYRTGILLEKLSTSRKIGYGKFSSLTDIVEPGIDMQRSARAVALLRPIYPDVNLATLPLLDVSAVSLPNELKNISAPLAAIAPGSVWKTKRWLPERFAAVAAKLSAKGYLVTFIGSAQDRESMMGVKNLLAIPHMDLVGKTTIAQAAKVIANSRFLLTNDSAPVHIATALRIPSIVLFGPTVRQFGFAPPADLGSIVERSGLWCRPCTSHGSDECPVHTHACMTTIPDEQVLLQIEKFVEFNGI